MKRRAQDRERCIRDMKRGETGYVVAWTQDGDTSAYVSPEPCGTADTKVRRLWWGFEFVGQPERRRERRQFAIVMVAVLLAPFLLMGVGGALMVSGAEGAWETIGGVAFGVGGLALAALLLMGFGGP